MRPADALVTEYGLTHADASLRLRRAIHGEPESAEMLGLDLCDATVAGMSGVDLTTWGRLSHRKRVSLRYAEARRQLGARS